MGTVGVGVAIFDEMNWNLLRQVSDDDVTMSFAEYEREVERHAQEFARRGYYVHRVDVNVDQLVDWCRRQDRKIDAEARAEYAGMLAQRRSRH